MPIVTCKACGIARRYSPSALKKRPLQYCRKCMPMPTRTHGLSKTRLYNTWKSMLRRCYTPSQTAYALYGGRGITVCDMWRTSFTQFHEWAISTGYSDTLTIDRIDNQKGYYPENCRWITQGEQCRNTRRVKLNKTKAIAIRQLRKTQRVPYQTLATMFGVSKASIKSVLTRHNWKAM